MRTYRMIAASILLAASVASAQTKGPRKPILWIGAVPDPAMLYLGDAHVRVENRPDLGIVIAIDEIPVVQDPALRKGDGIIDRVLIFQGADPVESYDGTAFVQIRCPADLCRPPAGVSLIDPENTWVCPAAPEEIIITGKGISLAAFFGARSKRVPEDAVIPSRMIGIITYTGPVIAKRIAEFGSLEIPQP